uniref:STING ligand-binding domain-containing protein n=2 Tax=Ixodes ricinus TaxID=34613 RepID=V5H0H5_IXORI
MVLGFLRDQWHLLLLMGLVCQLCTWWRHRLGLLPVNRGGPMPGEGLAYSAFCTFFRRLPESLRERISKYEDDHGVKLAVKKLFILLPSSCYIDPLLGSGQDEVPGAVPRPSRTSTSPGRAPRSASSPTPSTRSGTVTGNRTTAWRKVRLPC